MVDMIQHQTSIGTILPRSDGPAKIRGIEKFAADYYETNMLWAGVKRSEHAHALIKEIDSSQALKVPGVVAVLSHKDIKGSNRIGVPEMDQPILADIKVRYLGDPVVLVVAQDKASLAIAMQEITVEYEVLPAVFDPVQALEKDAPVLHEERPDKNLLLQGSIKEGDGSLAFEDCEVTAEADFYLPCQEHAYLETEAGIACVRDDGGLEIIASTQTPFRDRNELGHALGLPPDKIRVIAPYLGGAFGGKDGITVQGLLGLAAMHSDGRPVKMWTNREESFLSSLKRHSGHIHYRLGCKKDGTLQAMSCRIVLDTGAYASLGGPVLVLAMEHAAGVYRIPNTLVEGVCVYTNNPVAGGFRGFGVPQVLAGLEQMIDLLADKIELNPLEFRLKNAVNRGDKTGCGVWMTNSTGILQCLEKVQAHTLWQTRDVWVREAPAYKRRGVGIAAGLQGTGYGPMVADIANAKLELTVEGRIRIYSGVSDMGQGNNPTNIQMAGELLNQAPHVFDLIQPDTFLALPSGSSAGSRTTYSYGNALKGACDIFRERILTRACNLGLGIDVEDLLLSTGKLIHLPTGQVIPLSVIASGMSEAERIFIYTYKAPVAKYPVQVDPIIRSAGFPHHVFAFACHLARIEVDELTGEVSVCDYLACTDGGRVLNPQLYEQQIQGGVVQGMGYALCEDFMLSKGEVLTRNLATYILPTALDVPDIICEAIETHEETGPFGMKGIGEMGINLPLPTIANAVARALGQRIYRSPLTNERVLNALAKEVR